MKQTHFRVHFLMSLAVLAVVILGCHQTPPAASSPIRLGWQPPWANQGQIVEVLKNSNILSENHVTLDYKSFTYGGPMTEAALAGQLDIFFSGDQPAMTLMSRDSNWRIVARMVNYRSAIIVPRDSPIRTLNDLVGKNVATAFGSTTHRDAYRVLTDAGLKVGKDVTFVNLDQAQHATVIAQGGRQKWGIFAAIATYDPTIAVAVQDGYARVLTEWASPGVVVANTELIEKRPEDLKRFLQAYIESYALYAQNPGKYDALFESDSRLPLPPELYRVMAKYEPNLSIVDPKGVRISIDASQEAVYQRNVDIALQMGLIKQGLDMSAKVNSSIANQATSAVSNSAVAN